MTDTNVTENDDKAAGAGDAAAAQEAETQTKETGTVSREVLRQQGAEWQAKLGAMQAKVDAFEASERETERSKLEKAKDIEGLKTSHATELATLRQKIADKELEGNVSDLKMRLVAAGLDPDDPTNALIMKGILTDYDAKTPAAEFFADFKQKNSVVFEKPATSRTVSATGTVMSDFQKQEVNQLVIDYTTGDAKAVEAATNAIIKLNKDGGLTPELMKRLGLPTS